jgi:hypothetical protein
VWTPLFAFGWRRLAEVLVVVLLVVPSLLWLLLLVV